MSKNHFCIILIICLSGSVYSQILPHSPESSDSGKITRSTDSGTRTTIRDYNSIGEITRDSLIPLVENSEYLPSEKLRGIPQKRVDQYIYDPDYAYANDSDYWKTTVPEKPGLVGRFLYSKPLRWLLFILLTGLVLFGIYQLARENNFRGFIRSRPGMTTKNYEFETGEGILFDESIQKYQANGNYRLAIRYLYLKLIHTASGNNLIQIRDSSTNAEIAHAFGNHQKAGEFRFLITAYEYVYFGDFHLSPEHFNTLKKRFDNLLQSLSA